MTPERQLEILTRTRGLIADERRWGQGTLVQHTIIDRLMMRPPSLCLMGAIMHAAHGRLEYSSEVYSMVDALAALVPCNHSAHVNPVTAYNDHHSHAEVLALVDLAILETAYRCNHLYAPADQRSMSIIDISNPANPVIVR